VDDFIPVQQILDTYIPNFTGELDMSGATAEDPTDPEMTEEEPMPVATPMPEGTPAPEEAAAPEGTPAPEAAAPEGTPAPEAPETESKEVPVKVHHETLFDDAPDK
jgi:hypothetical protein